MQLLWSILLSTEVVDSQDESDRTKCRGPEAHYNQFEV